MNRIRRAALAAVVVPLLCLTAYSDDGSDSDAGATPTDGTVAQQPATPEPDETDRRPPGDEAIATDRAEHDRQWAKSWDQMSETDRSDLCSFIESAGAIVMARQLYDSAGGGINVVWTAESIDESCS